MSEAEDELAAWLQKFNESDGVENLDQLDVQQLAELLASQHCVSLLEELAGESDDGLDAHIQDELLDRDWGRYRLLRLLGSGGFARVYLAEDREIDRLVAIKIPVASALQSPEAKHRFVQEAKAAGQLDHPRIVSVYEVGHQDGLPFIVFAYCPGLTLAQWLEQNGPAASRSANDQPLSRTTISPALTRQIAEIAWQLADAVTHAHNKGVIHRDLKPANVLVGAAASPEVMVSDFGMAKQYSDLQGPSLTREGFLVGTPAYMSPEQSRGEVLGPPSDIFSLGSILFEMLTGETPFQRSTTPETLMAVQQADLTGRRLRGVDRDLSAICLKCLQRDAADRYASAYELRQDLRNWLDGLPVSARHLTPVERLGKWTRRNPTTTFFLTLAIGLLMITSVSFSWLWWTSETQRQLADRLRIETQYQKQDLERSHQVAVDKAAAAERSLKLFLASIDNANPHRQGKKDVSTFDFLQATNDLVDSTLQADPRARAPILESLGRAYSSIGYLDQAIECQKEVLEIAEREFGLDDAATARAHRHLALSLGERGRWQEAIQHHQAAGNGNGSMANRDRKWQLHYLAQSHLQLGQYGQAMQLLEQQAGLQARDLQDPRNLESLLLPSRLTLIELLIQQGDLRTAWTISRKEWDSRIKSFGDADLRTLRVMQWHADVCYRLGQFERAIEVQQKLVGYGRQRHPEVSFTWSQRITLATWLGQHGRGSESLESFEELHRELLENFDWTHAIVLKETEQHAATLRRLDQTGKAIQMLKSTLEHCENALGTLAMPGTTALTLELAECYRSQSKLDLALEVLQRCCDDFEKTEIGDSGRPRLRLVEYQALCFLDKQQPQQAHDLVQHQLGRFQATLSQQNTMVQELALMLARIKLKLGDWDGVHDLTGRFKATEKTEPDFSEWDGLSFLASALSDSSQESLPATVQGERVLKLECGKEWRSMVITLSPRSFRAAARFPAEEVAASSHSQLLGMLAVTSDPWEKMVLELVDADFRRRNQGNGAKAKG